MAQSQIQARDKGLLRSPPPRFSTKPPTPRPFVSVSENEEAGGRIETASRAVEVGDNASGRRFRETGVLSLMSLDPVSLFSRIVNNINNTNYVSGGGNGSNRESSNDGCHSYETSKAHVECSVFLGALRRRREGAMTMGMAMMQEEEVPSLVRKLRGTAVTQVAISRTMCHRLQGLTCPQDRVILEGKRHGRGWRRIMLALFVLVAVSSTNLVSAAGGSEGYTRLENPTGAAYDPLQPLADQLMLPVVAGAPSPPSTADSNNLTKEQQAYKERLEVERIERQGSFYVELTPLERQLAAASAGSGGNGPSGSIRYSKEPLPWEGLGQDEDEAKGDENGIDDEDEASMGWSYSPWGGEFRYEILSDYDEDIVGEGDELFEDDGEDSFYYEDEEEDEEEGDQGPRRKIRLSVSQRQRQRSQQRQRQQDGFSAKRVDNDDGSSVVEEQGWSRLELAVRPQTSSESNNSGKDEKDDKATVTASPERNRPLKEVTRALKMEAPGESGELATNQDPNVDDDVMEAAVDSQVWDAEGAAQPPSVGNTQLYIEAPLGGDDGKTKEEAVIITLAEPTGARSFAAEPIGAETLDSSMETEVKMVRPKLDQIDLLGHEAEIDWLQEQDDIQRAWGARHHHHRDNVGHEDEEGEEEGEDVDEDVDEGGEVQEEPFSSSSRLSYNEWDRKHGGLNPKHSHLHTSHHRHYSKGRSEKQDRDEDGTLFPEPYSQAPYSAIVHPTSQQDPFSPLGYVAYNRQGDRVMDFSMVGWNEGNTDLPDALKDVAVIERLYPRPGADKDSDNGDDTERIQQALDRVAQQAKVKVRGDSVVPTGALALARGVYRISKPLKIRDSGVLFRGDPAGGSRIVCQWEPTGPRYAIEIEGKKDKMLHETRVPVVSDYTPVGSFYLALDPTFLPGSTLAVGDQVMVTRIGNDRWIEDIGMDDFDSNKKGVKPWKKMHARMFRTIRSLDPHTGIIQLDAPLPISIRRHYGGGWVTKYQDNKIRALGIQFLDMVFPKNIGRTTDDMLDEKGRGSEDYRFSYEIFANYALRIDLAAHVYFSHITTAFFHNFVSVGTDAHHLTFDSVVHSYPDDMLSGQSAFQLSGQLVLIKNSLSQGSFHFFVDINHVMGPNVVHRAQATNVGKPYQPLPLDFAPGEVGPHMKFCTGLLFDQVITDGSIQIVNRGDMGTGQGYSGANSVVWNSRAREGIMTHRASGFQNFVIGSEDFEAEDRMPWNSHGWKEHLGSEVLPGSLYLRQLGDRLERRSKGWVS